MLISVSDDVTENDCLDECQGTETCSWITHDSDGGLCELLEDCGTLDTSCDTCLSSQVQCSQYDDVPSHTGN